MTLITLLIVLLAERVALQSEQWQSEYYLKNYFSSIKKQLSETHSVWSVLFITGLPALAVILCMYLFDSKLIEFIASIFILAICVGNSESRKLYRQYLNAVDRGDSEAKELLHQQLQQHDLQVIEPHDEISGDETESEQPQAQQNTETLGETLIWINFKYYAAPIFYFVFLGLPGIIFYTTVLKYVEMKSGGSVNSHARTWLEWMYWLPARLVSLGYMLVGHFSNGLETWLKYAANFSKSSKEMLCKVALESERASFSPNEDNAKHMVKLTKRNMVVFLVVVALLTLYGQIV